MGRSSLLFISKCLGDLIISYAKVYAHVLYKNGFYKMFVMSLDFADAKNDLRHVQRNDIQLAFSPLTPIF